MGCRTALIIVAIIFVSSPAIFCYDWDDGPSPFAVDVELQFLFALLTMILTFLLIVLAETRDRRLEIMLIPTKRNAAENASGDLQLKKSRPDHADSFAEQEKPDEIQLDEDLHSRQIAVYGKETMRRLLTSNVLISGVGGLGAEIAKNLSLAGVQSITLHDKRSVELWDLSSNFLVTEADVGRNRAVASLPRLQELNTSVTVYAWTSKLRKEDLSKFQAVVFTETNFAAAKAYDDYCRAHHPPIPFITSDVRGLFGFTFCDFGPKFTVYDVNGEGAHSGYITHISNDNPAQVLCVDDERLEFEEGDSVVFTEVEGMTELNDGKPRRIRDIRPHSFTLEEDTSKFGLYKKGGIVTELKPPKTLNFKSLKDALEHPGEFLISDFSKFDHSPLLHLAFRALDEFVTQHGHLPQSLCEEDASALISLAKAINKEAGSQKLDEIDVNVLRHFCNGSRSVLNPMAAMFGGIVGQEVVKACTGKFHPIFQFFYFDSLESLPPCPLTTEDVKPLCSRYDAQICVLGRQIQQKLAKLNIFLVGSGALGCEFLKNLALMGAACGSRGKLTLTDDDIIEKSNLTRQFLFRDRNIGQSKSAVAATAAKRINPNLNVNALQLRVCRESENAFDEAFWESLNVVMTALDSVAARLYVDNKCVYHEKPLLESGTLGTKCNTQVVIPHMTENYGASRDPMERELPVCSIQSFPHTIHHCIAWARSEFEGMLESVPTEANALLSDRDVSKIRSKNSHQLKQLLELLVWRRCRTFEDCVKWSLEKFHKLFFENVKRLIESFPEDAKTTEGTYFWSSPKRFPKPLQFTASDPTHLSFISAASLLRAQVYGIQVPEWALNKDLLSELLDRNQKELSEKSASIPLDSEESEPFIKMLESGIAEIPPEYQLKSIHFDKDDNTHMELIASLANLRARNYNIPEVDKLKAKLLAGRIVPAIATTTAVATGLVCLELYKLLSGHTIDKYRNTFANLALPLFSMAEPLPPKRYKWRDQSWSVWDKWEIKGDVTVKELIQWFRAKGLTVYSVSYEDTHLYSSVLPKTKDRLNMKVGDLIRNLAGVKASRVVLSVGCFDDDSEDVEVPLLLLSI